MSYVKQVNNKIRDNTNDNANSNKIFVCDYMNTFSDYREVKYKKLGIDFHDVKHTNKKTDTLEFFDIFFNAYIDYIKVSKKSEFIFIMKKITNYDKILLHVLELYKDINIRFFVIESKYTDNMLDKNKDDYLCQYIVSYYKDKDPKSTCTLISNDKYRDRNQYIQLFNNIKTLSIRHLTIVNKQIENTLIELNIDTDISNTILNQQYKRQTIPKNKLDNIL